MFKHSNEPSNVRTFVYALLYVCFLWGSNLLWQTEQQLGIQYQSIKSLRSVSKEQSFYSVNRFILWPYFYRPSFNVWTLPFLSVLRTVYMHRLYAHGKRPAPSPKSFEFQVWIWRRFLPVTGSKGSWYTTVKATKPLAGTVVTWNCFAHFLRTG